MGTISKIKRILNGMANRAMGQFASKNLTGPLYQTFSDFSVHSE